MLSHVQLFATPWTVAHQAPVSMGFFQARILKWVAISFSRGSSWPRDQTQVSWIAGSHFTLWATREALRNALGSSVSRSSKIVYQEVARPMLLQRSFFKKPPAAFWQFLSDLTNAKTKRKIISLVKPLLVCVWWNGVGWQPGEVVIIF